MAKFNDIKSLSKEEINGRMKELKAEALDLRLKHSAGQLENTARLREIRREIAQFNTVLTAQAQVK